MKSLFLTAAEDTASNLNEWWSGLATLNLNDILSAAVIFLVGYMLIKWICKLLDKLLQRNEKLDPSIRGIAVNAGRILLLFLLLLTCADKLGLPPTSILPLLFVAPTVGIVEHWGLIRPNLLPIALLLLGSTVLTFAISGLTTKALSRKEENHD